MGVVAANAAEPRVTEAGDPSQLAALFSGGTPVYFSPEQAALQDKLMLLDAPDLYNSTKELWPVTPATSDLYAVGLTLLECFSPLPRHQARTV